VTSPLHAALGAPGSELTIELLREACEQRITETDQLDFKRDLPLAVESGADETRARTLELAKDLAAMANGRGGLIVYGIREDKGQAAEASGIGDISDGVIEKRIHQVAYNFVYPPLQVQCHPLVDGEMTALVVQISESDQAPHLVHPKRDGGNDGWLVAPFRSGPDTLNMVESQLEAAYRRRIDLGRERVQQLRDSLEELANRHIRAGDRETGTVLAVMRPTRPAAGSRPGDSSRLATQMLVGATILASQIAGELRLADQFPITLLNDATTPRRGLRRHVFSKTRYITDVDGETYAAPVYVALELHDDGGIGLVWRRGAGYSLTRDTSTSPPAPSIGRDDMNIIGILMLSLMITVHSELELTTDFQVRVAIRPDTEIGLIPSEGWSSEDCTRIPAPPTLEAEIRMDEGHEVRAADFLAIGEDLVNMTERTYSSIEGFWELPRGIHADHVRLQLARRLFGGEPPHPVSGVAMY
jgi:hypothetical protein